MMSQADYTAKFTCAACGGIFQEWIEGKHTSNYGKTREGAKHCLECCAASERESLKDTKSKFFAYVSGDGKEITGWPGNRLMRVTSYAEHRTGFNGSVQAYIRAIDVHGQSWHGRGPGRGMYCNLKACKA